jgi:uncharacterized protein YdeI (YjbR/CyaY-like superfamily)
MRASGHAVLPEDLRVELDRDPVAARAFSQLKASERYSIVWRLNDARRAETRARRLKTFLQALRQGPPRD